MKLNARQAMARFSSPDSSSYGLLIHGTDPIRVALKRQEIIAALIGPRGEAEMRLTRIPGASLRKDPALLPDAIRARSFFPGPRVVLVEDLSDALAGSVTETLSDWQEGDARLIATAGRLAARSALRKFFEAHDNVHALGVYDDPPSREEIEADLAKAGLGPAGPDGAAALQTLSRTIGPGDFRQVTEKLALYKLADEEPISAADVEAVAPLSIEAALDDVLNIVAEGRTGEIGPILSRLKSQGVRSVSLCMGAARHFRQLYIAASDPGGVAAGIARLRPPVYGPRRDRLRRQAQAWGPARLEHALTILTSTDLMLRSSTRAPAMAAMERALVRLAMLGQR